jgi:hypothetical protein
VEIILQRLLPDQLNQVGEIRMIYSTHDLGAHAYKKIWLENIKGRESY